jgi:hypothetical protein
MGKKQRKKEEQQEQRAARREQLRTTCDRLEIPIGVPFVIRAKTDEVEKCHYLSLV